MKLLKDHMSPTGSESSCVDFIL